MIPITKTQYIFLIFSIILSFIASMIIYKSQTTDITNNSEKEAIVSSDEAVKSVILPKSGTNSDLITMKSLIDSIDENLKKNDISTDSRVQLLLKKGFTVAAVRSSSDMAQTISESTKQFEEALSIINENENLKDKYLESAKFGLLYNFVSNCFSRPVIGSLAGKHRSFFKGLPSFDSTSIANVTQNQKASFQSMIDYAYTDETLRDSSDKSVISFRMFLASIYFSSFAEQIPTDEKISLLDKISDDMQKYHRASFTIFGLNGRPYHILGELYSSFHYAFTFDIFTSYNSSNMLTQQQRSIIDKNYSDVRYRIDNSSSTDSVALSMLGFMNDGYHLSSMQRRYTENDKQNALFLEVISSFKKNVFRSPETADIAKGSFNYTLSVSGHWALEKKRIFELAKNETELHGIFTSIGVKI